MDNKLLNLINAGEAEIVRILDGVHHVKEVATGKIYQWQDGPVAEVKPDAPPPPPPKPVETIGQAVDAGIGVANILKKHGLGGFFK